jgi:chromosome partitioning protein
MHTKIISIFNQKGGVSKTTSAINISTCLSMQNKKVLLVDNDPQGNCSESFGMYENEKTICNVMVEGMKIKDAICKTALDNLYILPANISHAGTELHLINAMSREMTLAKAMKKIVNDFDYIIIDCPPSLGLLSINSLAASEHIIIPIRVGKYALRGLKNLFSTVEKVKEHLNENLSITGIFITQDDANTKISREIKEQLNSQLDSLVFKTAISKAIKVVESEFESKPIVVFDKSSKVSKEYIELTKEVVERVI